MNTMRKVTLLGLAVVVLGVMLVSEARSQDGARRRLRKHRGRR